MWNARLTTGTVRRVMIILGVAILFLFLLIAGFFGVINWIAHQPNGKPGQSQWINVRPGMSSVDIADVLTAHGLIQSPLWFRLYLFITQQGADLQAGHYKFQSGMTIAQVVHELKQGAAQYNTVRVTIPEGFTVRQIATVLAAKKVCSYASFMYAVQHDQFSYWFIKALPHNPAIRDRLEGYLFPDTYDFLLGESPKDVLNAMLGEMNQVLTPKRLLAMRQEDLTLTQMLTIASMVEREAKLNRERPLIASVIFNRLHHHPPMRLRIDATVLYAIGDPSILPASAFTVNSPYNTYVDYGLPPGPIANPGLASIEATLHPAKTDYYYYVAKGNGTGASYFATTYQQQLANEAKRQQNLAKRQQNHTGN
ncbi:endolytic transglycosylase MltG [Sulfoacidibacillus thermotolerans]|uniref:Endolytic murein transglycosylase n=1 Tax=Sulfoacidibacillus thermotolerans TaxID=1765684 RepID=A0A2U3D7E4_SULT2|nr:endolytic transglycosylase MltG [Sulfoacidibacillus thermotolerans]PWI57197.1 hypothetical protein BM613_10035 [Sulfoacidibacillus thermotolerans]